MHCSVLWLTVNGNLCPAAIIAQLFACDIGSWFAGGPAPCENILSVSATVANLCYARQPSAHKQVNRVL